MSKNRDLKKLKLKLYQIGKTVVLAESEKEAVFKVNKPWSPKGKIRKVEEFR